MSGIDNLIINSAFCEPRFHWKYNRNKQSFDKYEGRRPAGYFIAGQGSNAYNDDGEFIEIELVNLIRPLVKKWRENGYIGVTGTTKKLLEHWNAQDARENRFFWCQLDAIETLIWLTEAPETTGINIPNDGGPFKRICSKLCTGGGKTIVMAMLIAWHICNKANYPKDKRFSKNIFIVAPGLTVKKRLQVLLPSDEENYYERFKIVPVGLFVQLLSGKIIIENWHSLAWETNEALAKKKSVDKRGAKSDEAYTRGVLGEMSRARNILVINDEAHHAWRANPEREIKLSKQEKEAEKEATIWLSGLDRIHKTRGIHTCYDFSATPFTPSGKKNESESLFKWIVSDFGLNDGIESGIVKTPRVIVRDDGLPDAKSHYSKIHHIYADEKVRKSLSRAKQPPSEPLPELLSQAYILLGKDWLKIFNDWKNAGSLIPPVMITVANRMETAERIERAFIDKSSQVGAIDQLCELILRVDSNNINDDLREKIDTIGQIGKSGEQIRNVISVGMLSEGWDAKNVTHIMGLRAFSSQLLCEQVVGRGLRRVSYDIDENGFFEAERVVIFGVPFAFLPHEYESGVPRPLKPKTQIEVLPENSDFNISWPNIIRFDRVMNPILSVDISKMDALRINVADVRTRADTATIIDGKPDLQKCSEIDLLELDEKLRMQTVVFQAAKETYRLMKNSWQSKGTEYALFGQIVKLVNEYLNSDKIEIEPPLWATNDLRKRVLYKLEMNKIVEHLFKFIELEQTEKILPEFDISKKVRSAADMQTWYTSRPCFITKKSNISHVVYDSSWENTTSYILEKNPNVLAWAKNDHLGFEIIYFFEGAARKYYPDFLIKLTNGKILVLETKGKETRADVEKRKALIEWIEAINALREYGEWLQDISYNIADMDGIIAKYI